MHVNRRGAEVAELTQRTIEASTRMFAGSRLQARMDLFSNKAVRLLLVVSVSLWMAGGCMFGCANSTMGAEMAQSSENVIEAGMSCHAKHSQVAGVPSFVPSPRGMMNECPLVVNSTAVTSKNSTHVPDPGRGPIAALPSFEKQIAQTDNIPVAPFRPDRGPTHLRCCVFLI